MQTRDRLLAIATRPGRCPQATCPGSRMRLLSAAAQSLAPPGSTYGDDGLVHIGWLRQYQRATSSEMHLALAARLSISEAHGRYLSQPFYFPLLACHERPQRGRLAQGAQEQGGVLIARDGLAPQGGEPQLGFVRDLSTGLTRRSGWLARLDQPPCEAFLAPLRHLEWPILAVRSATQTGLVPAVAAVLPDSCPQFCQAHDLRHLAEPLATADAAFKSELRQTVRAQSGALLRQEPQRHPSHAGVLTVTGLFPSPVAEPTTLACHRPTPAASPTASAPAAEQGITQRVPPTRSFRTRKGRPPFRLAGMETSERLHSVACVSLDLLAKRYAPRLAHLYQGLPSAFSPLTAPSRALHQGAAWLQDIADIVEPVPTQPRSAEDVAGHLRRYLATVQRQPQVPPALETFGRHRATVSRTSWPGLFQCDAVPGLPRTTTELESHLRATRRRLLRPTGPQGQTQRTLQRQGAWALLPHPPTEAK